MKIEEAMQRVHQCRKENSELKAENKALRLKLKQRDDSINIWKDKKNALYKKFDNLIRKYKLRESKDLFLKLDVSEVIEDMMEAKRDAERKSSN